MRTWCYRKDSFWLVRLKKSESSKRNKMNCQKFHRTWTRCAMLEFIDMNWGRGSMSTPFVLLESSERATMRQSQRENERKRAMEMLIVILIDRWTEMKRRRMNKKWKKGLNQRYGVWEGHARCYHSLLRARYARNDVWEESSRWESCSLPKNHTCNDTWTALSKLFSFKQKEDVPMLVIYVNHVPIRSCTNLYDSD